MFKIVRKQVLSQTIKLIEVSAPEIAAKVQAGQFAILRISENGERIPLTIADFNREDGTITFIFQEVGHTTINLGKLESGDHILDLVGPLGMPSQISDFGTVVCVGGGIGVASIYPIARALANKGNRIISIIGARSKDDLLLADEIEKVSDKLYITTEDGALGQKGLVTDVLKGIIDEAQIDLVVATGPVAMMKAVSEMTRPANIRTTVSINSTMVDGTGMCGACRVEVNKEAKFACVDGPEFDGHLVDWDIVEIRSRTFIDKEKMVMEGCTGGGCSCQR